MTTRALATLLALAALACDRTDEPAIEPGPELQVVGETVKLRRGDPLPRESAIFDGQTVRMRLARGDTFGVQVLRAGAAPVDLALAAPGVTVTGFAVGYLTVREPSTPHYGPSLGRGDYPDILTPVAGPVVSADAALFDVAVTADARPGLHRGVLTVGDRAVPVELTIDVVTIDLGHAPPVWVWYKRQELGRVHGVRPDDAAPAWRALEDRYAAVFRDHGAFLASDLPPVEAARSPLGTADLAFFPTLLRLDDGLEADATAAVAAFAGTGRIPFAIPIDEPRDLWRRLEVRAIGERIHRAGVRPPGFLMVVTDRPRWIYGDAIDVFMSPHAIPLDPEFARRGVRGWTYNGEPPRAGSMILDADGVALRTWGWITARYQVELWHAWEGLYYTDRYNEGTTPTDVMTEPLTFDERRRGGPDHGNGEGVLVYPGPLPSLRLKALRRGLADRLLLEHLRRCGSAGAEAAATIARGVVPRALGEAGDEPSWPRDERGFEAARIAVLDAIAGRCGR